MSDEHVIDAAEKEEFSAAAPPDPEAPGTGETSFADAQAPAAADRREGEGAEDEIAKWKDVDDFFDFPAEKEDEEILGVASVEDRTKFPFVKIIGRWQAMVRSQRAIARPGRRRGHVPASRRHVEEVHALRTATFRRRA